MEEIVSSYFNPQQLGLIYKVLNSGGFIKVSDKYGIKIDKYDGFVKIAITVSGKEIDEKLYFKDMVTSYIKKKKEPAKEKPKVIEPKETKKDNMDLFG